MDIRGYGQSSKPSDIACYAKSAMSHDCIVVMDSLFPSSTPFYVLAHDRGARVAHKLAVDHPHRVRAAIFLDICPTLGMYEATNLDFAKGYWHWFFLIQPSPLPETLISANPRRFAELCMGAFQPRGLDIFVPEAFDAYVASLADEDTLHAMCQDYRAAATLDLDEAREDLAHGRLIQSPLLVLWGAQGVVAKQFDAVKEWRSVTKEGVTVEGRPVESGHYMPEEIPDEIVETARQFFK
ncbi:hypothetical protein N0V84_003631 [Fusarium piperis]|uniref:AB hydrolase-1 domain-containing protein n=1 Tax=Fusarium piperis TaxID=1435070 RepID=A0A9W8WHC9_9HYPO|nr:hypothetical protein N0V84_003631 [Fusarium piperis]